MPVISPRKSHSGVVIFDATCLKRLEDTEFCAALERSLAVADFRIWLTAINAAEIAKSGNLAIARRGLAIIERMTTGRGCLPFPDQVLRESAAAAVAGSRGIVASNLDLAIPQTDAELATLRASAVQFTDVFEAERLSRYQEARAALKMRFSKRPPLSTDGVRTFLDGHWWSDIGLPLFLRTAWHGLGLAGDPPSGILTLPSWRLLADAEGALLYCNTLAQSNVKPPGFFDLYQMIYLAAEARRILVTEDKSLLLVGRAIIGGRYTQTLVENWQEFLSHHDCEDKREPRSFNQDSGPIDGGSVVARSW